MFRFSVMAGSSTTRDAMFDVTQGDDVMTQTFGISGLNYYNGLFSGYENTYVRVWRERVSAVLKFV